MKSPILGGHNRIRKRMSTEIQEIEVRIEDIKEIIGDLEALNRLSNNKDFKRIIDEGYFVKKACESVIARANPEMQEKDKQEGLLKTIDAIGELRQYFKVITALGQRARNELEQHAGLLEAVLKEDIQS